MYTPLAYHRWKVYIETSTFTKEIKHLLPDDEYQFQGFTECCKGVVDMKNEDFEKLVESVKEAGEIKAEESRKAPQRLCSK